MNAIRTFCGRRLLPLLVIGSTLPGFSTSARADALVSQWTDEQAPPRVAALSDSFSTRVVYRAEPAATTPEESAPGDNGTLAALPALAMILIFSPDTALVPPSAPMVQQQQQNNPGPGPDQQPPDDGHTSGNPTPSVNNPEPASLILALTGSATAGVLALVRRRRGRIATEPVA